jgi:TrmH family RNA methyltransferase
VTLDARPVALGPRHHDVKRLRALLRDPAARASDGAFVLEGPRLLADALRRGAPVSAVYLGTNARTAFRDLIDEAETRHVPVAELKEGVLEKLGTTRTPQPVLAVVPIPDPVEVGDLTGAGPVLVALGVADPGNLGTLIRSAEAAGCAGVVVASGSVDVFNPRTVRASAGSVLGVSIAEPAGSAADPAALLATLAGLGRRCYGASSAGVPAADLDLAAPVALVLGNEARGLPPAVTENVHGLVAVPMAGAVESLNVAMAGTVLAFEAQRQRGAGEKATSLDSGSP